MRFAFGVVVALLVSSCGPSLGEQRLQRVTTARVEAQQRAGARQAAEYAESIHAAYVAGDYRTQPQRLRADAGDAIAILDRAAPNAGPDEPTLVAWRALMFDDLGQTDQGLAELQRSFALAPNALAGRNLVVVYGAANLPQKVGETCNATIAVMRSDDDKLDLIALCRTNMNAASPDGEMAWMSPDLVAWYQAENARRMGAEIDADNARREQQEHEQRVVRQTEQCAATCKERGLTCQNDCGGDQACEDRCVEWNHACLDRCESAAYEKLGQ